MLSGGRMQIADLMAMSNAVQMPPTPTAIAAATDLRPYYLKDLDLGKRAESMAQQKGLPPCNKPAVTKSKKHK